MTFDATVNPVVYEGGVPVFIDTEYDTWKPLLNTWNCECKKVKKYLMIVTNKYRKQKIMSKRPIGSEPIKSKHLITMC